MKKKTHIHGITQLLKKKEEDKKWDIAFLFLLIDRTTFAINFIRCSPSVILQFGFEWPRY